MAEVRTDHNALVGAAAIHQFAYKQATDPGAVGAGKGWIDTSTGSGTLGSPYTLKVRNAANTSWEVVGAAGTVASQNANLVYAGPASGAAAVPTFRALVAADIPAEANQNANLVKAGPASGAAAAPGYRALVSDDLPTIPTSKLGIQNPNTFAAGPASGGAVAAAFRALVAADIPAESNQSANTVKAGPASGGAAAPGYRALVEADIPTLAQSKITSLVADLAAKIAAAIFTAKGQLLGASASGTPVVVPAPSTNGYVLTADSAQTPGMLWAAPTGGVGGGVGGLATSPDLYKETKIRGTGNKTTTSATFSVVDNTNLPPLSLKLNAGDVVRCSLEGTASSSTNAGILFDFQVVQPTLGTVRTNNTAASGAVGLGGTTSFSNNANVLATFTATEPGTHTFQPVWRTTAGTATLYNSTSTDTDIAVLFSVEKVGLGGALLTPASNLLFEGILLAPATSIESSVLSQAYKALRIEYGVRGDTTGGNAANPVIRCNGDSSNIYNTNQVRASGAAASGVEVLSSSGVVLNAMPTAGATASRFATGSILIPDYTGAAHKNLIGVHGWSSTDATGATQPQAVVGVYRSTSPVTRISLTASANNLVAGSWMRIYGEPVAAGGASVGTGTRLRLASNLSVADASDTIVGFPNEDSDADSQHYTSSAALSAGTVAKTAGSATLVGTSTVFLSDLSVGQVIVVPGTADEKRVVIAIASDTSLTVNAPFANTASTQVCTRVNSAIVARQPGHYTLGAGLYWASSATGFRRGEFVLNDTTPFGRDDRMNIGAVAMGMTLTATRQLQQWDFVELRVHHTAGAALDLTADERTYFTCNARPTIIIAPPEVIFEYQVAPSTQGGTFTAGAWQTRPMNTKVSDAAGLGSVASNQMTLAPGTYEVHAWAACNVVNFNQLRLWSVTDSAVVAEGGSNYAGSGMNALLDDRITIQATKVLELQHRCSLTKTTDGMGPGGGFGTKEVYAHIEFRKVG